MVYLFTICKTVHLVIENMIDNQVKTRVFKLYLVERYSKYIQFKSPIILQLKNYSSPKTIQGYVMYLWYKFNCLCNKYRNKYTLSTVLLRKHGMPPSMCQISLVTIWTSQQVLNSELHTLNSIQPPTPGCSPYSWVLYNISNIL